MTDFKVFSRAVHARYEYMANRGELFVVDVADIFETYLAAYPAGTNPIFRVRTVHDCNCCKQFVRRLGTLIMLNTDGNTESVWDHLDVPSPYREVAARLSEIVRQAPIRGVFRSKERQYGQDHNFDTKTNARWDHFVGRVANVHYAEDPEAKRGEKDAVAQVLRRGLDELGPVDMQTVLDLIDANGLYRGGEHRDAVDSFLRLKRAYDAFPGSKANFVWSNLGYRHARFRNTVIGTLLVDLADGKYIEDAVRIFEAKVAPQNYKRTTALITPRMVEEAAAKLEDLGLTGAVHRRMARAGDVSVNDVLFVDNSVRGKMKGGIADILATSMTHTKPDPKTAVSVSAEDFLRNVLPGSKSVEAFIENRHAGNFVTLTGGDGPERMFRWGNNFAWSYDGEVTDSIKARVKAAGGNVDALLRVSLAWFNYDDLDIHCRTPRGEHIHYANKLGVLDVDMNAAGRRDSRTPVENLAFNNLSDGVYHVNVNNYMKCESADVGFTLEVEYNGLIQTFTHAKAVPNKVTVHDALKLDGMRGGSGIQVMPGKSDKLWWRGMRVLDLPKPSIFTYNVLDPIELTEDRTLKHEYSARVAIAKWVVGEATADQAEAVLKAKEGSWESVLDFPRWAMPAPSPAFKEVLTERRGNARPVLAPLAPSELPPGPKVSGPISRAAWAYYVPHARANRPRREPEVQAPWRLSDEHPRPWRVEGLEVLDRVGNAVFAAPEGYYDDWQRTAEAIIARVNIGLGTAAPAAKGTSTPAPESVDDEPDEEAPAEPVPSEELEPATDEGIPL